MVFRWWNDWPTFCRFRRTSVLENRLRGGFFLISGILLYYTHTRIKYELSFTTVYELVNNSQLLLFVKIYFGHCFRINFEK